MSACNEVRSASTKQGFSFALLLAALSLAGVTQAGWVIDGELTGVYDDNLSRAERTRDVVRDQSALGGISLGWRAQPSNSSALNLRGFLEGEAYDRVSSLDRATAGAQATLRWQPVVGFMEPVYQFGLTAQADNYQVRQRDSAVFTAQAFASRRINDRIMAAYGFEGVQRKSNGTVFDTTHSRAFLNMDFELTKDVAAYGSYSYLRGDTFSSAQLSFCNGAVATDIFGLISASSALESDEALNQKLCGSWVAYRLPATTHALTLGVNKSFGHKLSLDVSVQEVLVHAKGGNDYQRMLVRAGLLTRF